jgi:DNA/RNA-binding domain of Phe-tRNA-synthetase-like protein
MLDIPITISPEIKNILKKCRLGIVMADVVVEKSSHTLQNAIKNQTAQIRNNYSIDEVSTLPLIEETKNAYRALGKDPTRYRPSAEALTRRIILGKGLYEVNNVVDLLNLVSIRTGFSIGGYDIDQINGSVILTTGEKNDPYEAIGRGMLNIHLLPVLKDENGVFGSPTSDSARTMVRETTRNFLMVFFDFQSNNHLEKALHLSDEYLQTFASAGKIHTGIVD